jgi:hypothetical protein
MSRYDWLEILQTVDDSNYYWDNIPWLSFPFEEGFQTHQVVESEILRTWNIPLKYNLPIDYDDIILKINGFFDPDLLQPGDELKIPDSGELNTWLNQINPKR